LKTWFETQENLDLYLNSNLTKDKNGTIALDDLKDLIINTCSKELEIQKIGKKDVEAFLSSYVYNTYGHTDITKIAP